MYSFLKRSSDLFLAVTILILSWPVMVVIAVAILVESGRPIFFRQTRVGLEGTFFSIWKFRTLHDNAHPLTQPLSHVTRVGQILRRWGLDELPQLWNVIKGDMSLIGPRPTVPEQVARYGPFEKRRLSMRPGITGWAQIHGRNTIDWKKRIDLDIQYIEQANLGLDLRILAQTPFRLISEDGTYGTDGTNPDFVTASEA